MIKIKVSGIALLLALSQVACSGFPCTRTTGYVPPVVDGGDSVNSNLEEVHAASAMTELQQQNLLAVMEKDFRENPDVDNRLRLVLLLATGNAAVRDPDRARVLLEEIDTSTSISTSQRGLAVLLSQFLEEQEAGLGQLESCTKEMKQQERRINELEEQQKELTSIEQNIQHRDKPVEVEDAR